ncbi:hypothetical protein OG511_02555 [Streptomyces sp. NBC_01453]|uniref:hypothetical protein n=1 Tax=Streptomyces sp. NBC_01453 TaxID=2903873 RepID=UPI002E2B6BFC|nr:hypothetical protein [Streptomyces sp. NBC_01453]
MSVELPQRLQAWFAEHEERLQSCGITGAVQQSPEDGRTKNSTWMTGLAQVPGFAQLA